MALHIDDEETSRLARELAELTGQSITAAVRDAIRGQLENVRRDGSAASNPGLADIISRGRARQTLDDRSDDEIIGYDACGLS